MREAMSGSGGGGERRCHIVRDVVSYFRTRPPDGIFLDTSIMSLVFFSSLSLSLSLSWLVLALVFFSSFRFGLR